MTYEVTLGIVRVLLCAGYSLDEAIGNPAIKDEYRNRIREQILKEEVFTARPAHVITNPGVHGEWLQHADRHGEYYWQEYRRYLLSIKGLNSYSVGLLDEITDRILGQLAHPSTEEFDIRGLVIGYVQSGKTANYTALIAKAADVGYRFVIVLSGIDNGLRLQTQTRLKRELIGYADYTTRVPRSVPLPPIGSRWHEYTSVDMNGDFQPPVNHAALQENQPPVLLVVKKNNTVLQKLIRWIEASPSDVRRNIPVLMIDDEADQASPDTRGSRQTINNQINNDYEQPSAINKSIRKILRLFKKSAYVGYTATPFANILIPHDNFDPEAGMDLYPKDFIIDLPKPEGYFGAEQLFSISDERDDNVPTNLNVIRNINVDEINSFLEGEIPASLENALYDFVLAGSARAYRIAKKGEEDKPSTMLIHISHLIDDQTIISTPVAERFREIQEEWRYQKSLGIYEILNRRWNEHFRPITKQIHPDLDTEFTQLVPYINWFLQPFTVKVKTINSDTGEILDYEKTPSLKAIAIGGNRLSRGLTLEGLLVSYFARPVDTYDTLMQMGRWFGFRGGYEDITRIYTTKDLANAFSNIATAEHQLRQDLRRYEDQGLSPLTVGMRILQHPGMQVTNRLKRRYAKTAVMAQTYSEKGSERVMFPLDNPEILNYQEDQNITSLRGFLSQLGKPIWADKGPYWLEVPSEQVLTFLEQYRADSDAGEFTLPLILTYIKKRMQEKNPELIKWTVAVCGRETNNPPLGVANWGVRGGHIWQISRTRIPGTSRLGAITSPDDEKIGLSNKQLLKMEELMEKSRGQEDKPISKRIASRRVRSPEEGLLLFYPISKYSGYDEKLEIICDVENRSPLYDNPKGTNARDLIGIAVAFPKSNYANPVKEKYVIGTTPWRAAE